MPTSALTTLADLSDHHATHRPAAAALIVDDRVISYGELHERTCRTVAALRAFGIKKGDRVGYLALNHEDYAVLLLACLRIGAVLVAINWRLVAREISFILGDSEIRLLISERSLATQAQEAAAWAPVERIVLLDGDGDEPDFATWIAGFAPDAQKADITPDDIALQLYTSGTTGFPKGALLTHRNILSVISKEMLIGADWSYWSETDKALVAVPLFHIGGTGWLFHALIPGACAVILSRSEIADILDAISKHGITKLFMVPSILNMLLQHPAAKRSDFSSVRALLYGASPIPLGVLRRAIATFTNAQFVQCYGMTETCGTVTILHPEDHDVSGNHRMAGCGKAYPGTEIRIMRPDGTTRCDLDEVGELWIRSDCLMAGYHNRPEATAKALQDGWFRSGDAGYVDADGYFYIHDRIKDMIVTGAENVYPAEVENVLYQHPDVADCAVIGVPDTQWGEAVKAIIVRRPGSYVEAADLLEFARPRLAGFKLPKSIDFIESIPRQASGKILKRELRARYWPSDERQVG